MVLWPQPTGSIGGGLAVHLTLVALGGNQGVHIDLTKVPGNEGLRDDSLLFSESAGRFIVTLDPDNRKPFEEIFKGDRCACIGTVTDDSAIVVRGLEQQTIISVPRR